VLLGGPPFSTSRYLLMLNVWLFQVEFMFMWLTLVRGEAPILICLLACLGGFSLFGTCWVVIIRFTVLYGAILNCLALAPFLELLSLKFSGYGFFLNSMLKGVVLS
jgi:hypothetical protein